MIGTNDEIKKLEEQLLQAKNKQAQEEQNKPITKADLLKLLGQAKSSDTQQGFTTNNLPPPPKPSKDFMNNYKQMKDDKVYNKISKKTCAAEVYNNLTWARYLGIGMIVALLLTVLGSIFNIIVSGVACMFGVVPAAIYVQKVTQRLAQLKAEYKL